MKNINIAKIRKCSRSSEVQLMQSYNKSVRHTSEARKCKDPKSKMPEPELVDKVLDRNNEAPAKEVRASPRPPELKHVGARGNGSTAKVRSGQQHTGY